MCECGRVTGCVRVEPVCSFFFLCVSCLLRGRLSLQFASIFALTLDAARSHKRLQKVRQMLLSQSLYNLGLFPALMDILVLPLDTAKQVKSKERHILVCLFFFFYIVVYFLGMHSQLYYLKKYDPLSLDCQEFNASQASYYSINMIGASLMTIHQ